MPISVSQNASLFVPCRTTICDLYTMPRVAEPVWLTMRSVAPERQLLCSHFMRELALLVEQASKNQLSGLQTSNRRGEGRSSPIEPSLSVGWGVGGQSHAAQCGEVQSHTSQCERSRPIHPSVRGPVP